MVLVVFSLKTAQTAVGLRRRTPSDGRHVKLRRLQRESFQRRRARMYCQRRFNIKPRSHHTGNERAPIQLAQYRLPRLTISNAKILIYIFQIKCVEAILSNSTRKLLWLEITKMLIAV